MNSNEQLKPAAPERPMEVAWTVFPMKESPWRAVFFWIVVILTIIAVWWNLQSAFLTVIAAIVLLGALTSFFLPTHYRLNEKGAFWKRLTGGKEISWERVRSVSGERDGVFLSPYPVKSRMENFRGIYLPYRGNRDEVLEYVGRMTKSASGTEDTAKGPPTPNYFGHRSDR